MDQQRVWTWNKELQAFSCDYLDIQNGDYLCDQRVVTSGAARAGDNYALVKECIILDAEIATLKAINEELLLQNTQLTEELNFSTKLVEAFYDHLARQHAAAEKRDQPEPDTSLIK